MSEPDETNSDDTSILAGKSIVYLFVTLNFFFEI